MANKDNKFTNLINLSVDYKLSTVDIIISHSNDKLYQEKKTIDINLSSIFSEFLTKSNLDKNDVILKYNKDIIDTNQTILQFMNKYNINLKTKGLNNNNDNLIQIQFDVLYIHELSEINFIYQENESGDYYALGKNMGDIFKDYTSKNNKDKKKLIVNIMEFQLKKNKH